MAHAAEHGARLVVAALPVLVGQLQEPRLAGLGVRAGLEEERGAGARPGDAPQGAALLLLGLDERRGLVGLEEAIEVG